MNAADRKANRQHAERFDTARQAFLQQARAFAVEIHDLRTQLADQHAKAQTKYDAMDEDRQLTQAGEDLNEAINAYDGVITDLESVAQALDDALEANADFTPLTSL